MTSPPLSLSLPMHPSLPPKVYLRRKEVEAVVGGRRQREALEATGKLRAIRLPGYDHKHYIRAEVQSVIATLLGS